MKSFFLALSLFTSLFLALTFVQSQDQIQAQVQVQEPAQKTVAEQLQDVSVHVKAGRSQGSGTIIVRKNWILVLTAAHVIEGNWQVDDGVVFFKPVFVMQMTKDDETGKVVKKKSLVEVLNYSEDHDLALLRVKKKNFVDKGAQVYRGKLTKVGTDVYHCGCLLGEVGYNSISKGIVSYVGRNLDGKSHDQTDTVIFPGSSGGGMFLSNGQYIGMVVSGYRMYGVPLQGFSYYVPMRRMDEWAKTYDLEWVLDPSRDVPDSLDEIKLE